MEQELTIKNTFYLIVNILSLLDHRTNTMSDIKLIS